MEKQTFSVNLTSFSTAQAEKQPEKVQVREEASSSDGSRTELRRGGRRETPDVQLQLGGLSLTEEEERLLKTPPKGTTAREATPVTTETWHKYRSKTDKKKAKLERRKAIGVEARVPVGSSGGEPKPGPSKRGLKVKRRSTDEGPSERPPAKRPNQGKSAKEGPRSVAKANRGLAVAVCREDGVLVDEALAKLIRRKLTQLIEVVVLQVVRGEPGVVAPRFAASGLVSEGFFLVTPKSMESREWLLNQDFGELDGHRISVRKLEQTRVQVWIPGDADTEYIKEFIYAQNPDRPELQIMEWKAVGRETLELGTRLTYVVPDGVEEIWGEERIKVLDFSATNIRLRILRANPHNNPKDPKPVDIEEPAALQESAEPVDLRTDETKSVEIVGSELSE